MNWEDILKRRGRDVKRPASKSNAGRKMSGFSQKDADKAKRQRDKLMNSPEAQRARENSEFKRVLEEFRNSPEYKKEQEERKRLSERSEKYGKVMCRDCGEEYLTDGTFKGKCDGKATNHGKNRMLPDGCGAEGDDMFSVVQEGEMGNTKRYM